MSMPVATGRRITVSGIRTFLLITSPSPVTTAKIRPAPRSVRAGQCTSVKMVCRGQRRGVHWLPLLPYGLPVRRPAVHNADKGHMTKCDGCHGARRRGEKPICVESCPLRAPDFGPIAELRAKHGQLAAVAPLPSAHFTRPSIVIKPNANARPCGDTTGYLANPKEV